MNEVGHLGSNPGNPANIQRLKIVKLLSIISAAAKLLLLGETIDFRSRENEWFLQKLAQNFNVLFLKLPIFVQLFRTIDGSCKTLMYFLPIFETFFTLRFSKEFLTLLDSFKV